MMKLFFPLILLFFSGAAHAASPGDVVINEIAWMGSLPKGEETASQAANDEWLELFNNSANPVDLAGWIIQSTDGNPAIELSGTISHGAYFFLSRANQTVSGVSADLVYPYDTKKSALSNSGEHLQLVDSAGNTIDEVNAWGDPLWSKFGGDNETKQTMERNDPKLAGSDPDNWGTSANPGGTPKAQNSLYQPIEPTPEPAPEPQTQPNPEPEPTPPPAHADDPTPYPEPIAQTSTSAEPAEEIATSTISYSDSIFINEIMPFPTGPDELHEWIEITNENDSDIDISFWAIKDSAGVTNAYIFPNGSTISARGFLVISRPTSKITLNNDKDGLGLIKPDGKVAQILYYEGAPKGSSYARAQQDEWQWTSVPTPGSANILSASAKASADEPAPQKDSSISPQAPPANPNLQSEPSEPTIDDLKEVVRKYEEIEEDEYGKLTLPRESKDDERAKQLASIVGADSKNKDKFVIFGAIFLALFSGVFIFLLKKRAKEG